LQKLRNKKVYKAFISLRILYTLIGRAGFIVIQNNKCLKSIGDGGIVN